VLTFGLKHGEKTRPFGLFPGMERFPFPLGDHSVIGGTQVR
jgi:hypothetical protein